MKTNLEQLAALVEERGIEALLPHNLPENHFQYLFEVATKFVDGDTPEESQEVFSCLLFAATAIIKYQKKCSMEKTQLTDAEIVNAIQLYCIAISTEAIAKETGSNVAPITLENIFDESKISEFYGALEKKV